MTTEIATLGLVLAGGLARRMGGGDKPRMTIGGQSILARVIDRLAPQCTRLILNANGDPVRFADTGLPVVPDDVQDFAACAQSSEAAAVRAARFAASSICSCAPP